MHRKGYGFQCLQFVTSPICSEGEVLGSLSIPIGRGATMLKRAPSMRILNQVPDVKQVITCPLTKKVALPILLYYTPFEMEGVYGMRVAFMALHYAIVLRT
jgi:hypothetical protein